MALSRLSVLEILGCLGQHCPEAWEGGSREDSKERRSPGWGGGSDKAERAEGTHTSSEEGSVWAQPPS